MYQQPSEILTPHESIITQEVPGGELPMNYQDMSTLGNPTYTEFDFHLQHDVTGSNYFTYHADPSSRLGEPATDMYNRSLPHDYPYQVSHMTRDMYGSLPSENSGFMPGIIEGYNVRQFETPCVGLKRQRGGGSAPKGIEKKEKQRRERLGEKYEMLKALIPNRTKDDRATIVSDAIDYINELCRTVNELKLLVEKKRMKMSSVSFNKDTATADMESSNATLTSLPPDGGNMNGGEQEGGGLGKGPRLRSSWLQRRSKEALVDVRIIEDEVNIKITKKKKAIGCLLPVSRAIDELQLQVLNLSGGIIGECHVYMFNTQIMEGCSVYASAVAKKLIQIIDMY
ncbi:basic helix-loop-helix (bHLH) DNA-binding superfamily protein [Rhynchospora pubera]|uniref:Basic helix-loop-helix (BHLH) DNA-binding superfamily protein n=1 Tax=Rhynchospora pubera TaxID=906938 RepID=A0AAV8DSE6_9POAL|nr:basic helix-loop-helix (bHLH) DNA-binding superfamily protein [Rhynchospora pubera]